MIIKLVDGALILITETSEDRAELKTWSDEFSGHAFSIAVNRPGDIRLQSLGLVDDLLREPINIVFDKTPAPFNLISNLAPAPFHMDGTDYASIEGFWQGLKFPEEQRAHIAALDRHAARKAGLKAARLAVIQYKGREIHAGTFEHWQLMERACRAKFSQNLPAREALIGTGKRPLMHKVPKDSRTIPGVIMADIWMRLRDEIHAGKL